jgi:hypothetical protein
VCYAKPWGIYLKNICTPNWSSFYPLLLKQSDSSSKIYSWKDILGSFNNKCFMWLVWHNVFFGFKTTVSLLECISKKSDCELDDCTIRVRSQAVVKDLSSGLCVQTSSGAHPASCTVGTRLLSAKINVN